MLEFISILLVALAVAALVRMVWVDAKEKQMPASVAPAASYQMNFAATTAEPAAEPATASESESLEPEVSSTALSNANFIAVDFETATLKRSACQVGIVVVKGGRIVEKVNRLIKPPANRYTPRCMAVHGISPKMTEKSPTFAQLWPEIKGYFDANFVVAHNAKFDIEVLYRNLDMYHIPHPILMGTACTYEMTGLNLEEACRKHNISIGAHHDAESDAEACAALFLKYLRGEMSAATAVQYSPAQKVESVEEMVPAENDTSAAFHKQLRGAVLKKDLEGADPGNPFYDKKVVITGLFAIQREELADKLKSMGADIDTSIGVRTDFVLVGEEPGPKKMEKLEKLVEEGHKVRAIFEDELNEILSKY